MSELVNGKSQKKENLLNVSLDATEAEREKSPALQRGYDQNTKRWEIIDSGVDDGSQCAATT